MRPDQSVLKHVCRDLKREPGWETQTLTLFSPSTAECLVWRVHGVPRHSASTRTLLPSSGLHLLSPPLRLELLTSNLHYLMAHHHLHSFLCLISHLSHPPQLFPHLPPTHTLQYKKRSPLFLLSSVSLPPPGVSLLSAPLSLFSLASSGDFKCIRIRGSLPLSWPSFRLCSSQVQLPRLHSNTRQRTVVSELHIS